MTTMLKTQPTAIHGLNFPNLVLVASMILPMTGSLNASKILAAIMMTLSAANCAPVRFFVNKTYVSR